MFASCMPRVQLYVNACNGWPQFAPQHHWRLPINCHFLRLYSAAGRGIAAVSSAIEESDFYLCFLTGVFGLLSNLFVVVVIVCYRPMRSRVTNLYIINQSLIDATVAAFLFLTTLLQDDKKPRTPGNWADEALCRLWFTKMPLWGMLVSSTYNIVSLTIERFLAIVYPLRHRAWCSRKSVSASRQIWYKSGGRPTPLCLTQNTRNLENMCQTAGTVGCQIRKTGQLSDILHISAFCMAPVFSIEIRPFLF